MFFVRSMGNLLELSHFFNDKAMHFGVDNATCACHCGLKVLDSEIGSLFQDVCVSVR